MHWIDLTIISIYLLMMVAIGVMVQKKASGDTESFFLGSREMPWWMIGASGMASNLDVTGTMMLVGLIYVFGVQGLFIEIRGGALLAMSILMVFMGKWNRRSQVMTVAQWMNFRFGPGKQGDLARIVSAIVTLIFTVAMVSYFSMGSGKFVAEFLGMSDYLGVEARFWAALLMIFLASIYTISSGFYGVIVTDLFQSFLIFGTIIYICYMAFTQFNLPDIINVSVPLKEGGFRAIEVAKSAWMNMAPQATLNMPEESSYSIYNAFYLLVGFYFTKVMLEGLSGHGGYMAQRYFAAKNDKECGMLSAFWAFLISFRWPFMVAVAIMGISYSTNGGQITDPETVLPVVIQNLVPVGLKGFLVAGLMSAAMSSFDSNVNGGAAYWVNDIYKAFINKDASEKTLMIQSRVSSVVIVLIGLAMSMLMTSITQIWSWMLMSLGVGMLVPNVIRWFWWRMNGYGFALGNLLGFLAGMVQVSLFADWEEYLQFSFVALFSIIGTVVGSLLTKPTDEKVLKEYFERIRPFGWWGPIRAYYTNESLNNMDKENKRDILALFFAFPWQFSMTLIGMAFMLRAWSEFAFATLITLGTTALLYKFWYQYQDQEVRLEVK